MLFKWRSTGISEGVFKKEFRKQLLATLSVTLIIFCHGIGLGWLAPMLVKLQSPTESPLSFFVTVTEASWIGSLLSVGGLSGNLFFGCLLDRVGRKTAIYLLVIPHLCIWILYYFATSVGYLYAARICGGLTGGGIYLVVPIFIGEIADTSIRGRLTSTFTLVLNTGVLVGFVVSSHVPYHVIPFLVAVLPLLYLYFATLFPETPQHLLRHGFEERAEDSLKYYRNYSPTSKAEIQRFNEYFEELKDAVLQQKSQTGDVGVRDFLTKRSLRAICTGVVLMFVSMCCGHFALINYMSSIFAMVKTEMHPDTNTIIIGVVQIVGTCAAMIAVDRYGRKILLIVSAAGMGVGLAAFGMYAFFVEETDVDLSSFSRWLPLLLMAFIIFIGNVGVVSVSYVVLVEIMPAKIRSKATSFCLGLLSIFAFGVLKMFPIVMHVFGLSATMWFCASVCAFGLFYFSVFLKETKGKSMDKDDED